MLKRFFAIAAMLIAGLSASSASAQLANYFEDFEGLNRTDTAALSNAGWLSAAAGIPTGGGFTFFAGFPTQNDINNPVNSVISDVPSGGAPPVGNQGLVVFSDYNSAIHFDQPNSGFDDLIISVFQQQTIGAGDIGGTATFSWIADGNANPPTGDTLAEAFVLVLDPNTFAANAALNFDTTATADGSLAANSLTLDLNNPALAGNILQFGFRTTSSSGNGSAVDYDNVQFSVASAIPEPSSAIALAFSGILMLSRRRRS